MSYLNITAKYVTKRSGPLLRNPRMAYGALVTNGVKVSANTAFKMAGDVIRNIPEGAMIAGTEIMRETIDKVYLEALLLAPEKTGNLKDNIRKRVSPSLNRVRGIVSSSAPYGPFMEFGFRHWRNGKFFMGRPFLFPAFNRHVQDFHNRISNLFK